MSAAAFVFVLATACSAEAQTTGSSPTGPPPDAESAEASRDDLRPTETLSPARTPSLEPSPETVNATPAEPRRLAFTTPTTRMIPVNIASPTTAFPKAHCASSR